MIKESAIGMIKDCGLYYLNLFEEACAAIQEDIWRDVSKFVLSIVKGVEEIEQQNDTSSGYKTPPVLPCELVGLCSHQFNKIVNEQMRRFLSMKTKDDLEIIQQEHRNCLENTSQRKLFVMQSTLQQIASHLITVGLVLGVEGLKT